MSKPIQSLVASVGTAQPQPQLDDEGIRHVFKVLHGFYGNLFLSKWAIGRVEENGEDEGITNARRIWAYGLREFDLDDIKLALRRCQASHPEFPPSLPQFVALCEAAKPRKTWQPPAQPALEMSEELRQQRRSEAARKAREALQRWQDVGEVSGLEALKQSIASAVGAAGGDEASALLRLNRDLAPGARA